MSRKIVICKGIFIKNTSFNFLVFSEFTSYARIVPL